jgi:hypothetical protein
MRSMVFRVAVVLPLALGCGGEKKQPSAEEVHKQLAPTIEPKLQVIEKILKEPFPSPTNTIKLDGPMIDMIKDVGESKIAGNALYAFEADLRTLDRYQGNPLRYNFNGEYVNDCFQLVRKKGLAGGNFGTYTRDPMPWTNDEHIVRMKLPYCAALRYLLVIKLDAFKDTDYIDKEKFGGGGAIAQVHVFDLDSGGKHLGGVTFDAVSSEYVKGDIESDLRQNFYNALQKAVHAHVPDANLGP